MLIMFLLGDFCLKAVYVFKIKLLVNDPVPNVAKHAAIAVKVITWRP